MGIGIPKSGEQRQGTPTVYARVIHPSPEPIGAVGAQSSTRGRVYLIPFDVPDGTIEKVYVPLNSIGGGAVRFALYQGSSDSPQGQTKLADTGNVGGGVPGNVASATFNYAVSAGQYWLAMTCSTSAVAYLVGFARQVNRFCSATFSYRAGSLASNTIALPSPCPTVTIPGSDAMYFASLEVAT